MGTNFSWANSFSASKSSFYNLQSASFETSAEVVTDSLVGCADSSPPDKHHALLARYASWRRVPLGSRANTPLVRVRQAEITKDMFGEAQVKGLAHAFRAAER